MAPRPSVPRSIAPPASLCTLAGAALLVAAASLASGCSALTDTAVQQCRVANDCGAGGFECSAEGYCERTDSVWGCLSTAPARPTLAAQPTYRLRIVSTMDGAPLEGARVIACPLSNPSCSGEAVAETTSDTGGFAELALSDAFDGVVVASLDGFRDSSLRLTPADVQRGTIELSLYSEGFFRFLARFALDPVGREVTADTNVLIVEVEDCTGDFGEGAIIEVEGLATGIPYYVVDGFLTTDTTVVSETTSSGLGGVVDIPPGTYSVRVTVAESNALIATVEVPVLPGGAGRAFASARFR